MKKIFLILPLVGTVAACGGDTTDSSALDRLYSVDAGPASRALAAGNALVASSVASVTANTNTNTTVEDDASPDIQIAQRGDGHLTLTIDGTVYAFSQGDLWEEDDGDVYGYGKDIDVAEGSGDVSWVGLFSYNGELDQMLAEENSSAAQVWQYFLFDEAGGLNVGKFATGTHAAQDYLDTMTSATYAGWGNMHVMSKQNYQTWRTRSEMQFDVNLDVNMRNNTVSGQFENIRLRTREDGQPTPDYVDFEGQINITDGTLSGGDFSATFSADQTFLDQTSSSYVTGTLDGSLFGAEAEEAAGTLNGTSEDSVLFGHISTNKQ